MTMSRLSDPRGGGARVALLAFGAVAAWTTDALAQASETSADKGDEHTLVVGIGGAADVELGDGSVHPGTNVMVEWGAVEDWLELEVGASVLAADHGVEVPVDLLFKKPFTLARGAEMMVGLGPEVVSVANPTTKATYFGGEVAVDFMLWPWGRHVGLWVEPEYDVIFHGSASQSVGSTGGLLFGW
jgi:hypothetical protein